MKKVFALKWANEDDRSWGEVQALCSTEDLAKRYCEKQDWTYILEKDYEGGNEHTIFIEEMDVIESEEEIKSYEDDEDEEMES